MKKFTVQQRIGIAANTPVLIPSSRWRKPLSSGLGMGILLCLFLMVRESFADDPMKQVSAGRLSFHVPPDWTQETPASSMRKAQFKIPAGSGREEAPSLVVFHFGPNQGGSVEANLRRWEQQFEVPEGKSLADVRAVETKKIAGLNVTIMEMAGTYVAPVSPRNPTVRHNKPHFGLFGVVVETTDGPFFFKIVGPIQTMDQQHPNFMRMIDSLRFSAE